MNTFLLLLELQIPGDARGILGCWGNAPHSTARTVWVMRCSPSDVPLARSHSTWDFCPQTTTTVIPNDPTNIVVRLPVVLWFRKRKSLHAHCVVWVQGCVGLQWQFYSWHPIPVLSQCNPNGISGVTVGLHLYKSVIGPHAGKKKAIFLNDHQFRNSLHKISHV